MDVGTSLSVVQTLFNALQCAELRELFSILGYKSALEDLERTVNVVKAVLEEAECKGELPPQAQLYVDQLKDVVYDADDLLDEFVTLAQRKKLIKGRKVSKKVRLLFSRFNPLATAYKMSQGVKEIRKRLDGIANDHTKFGFKLDSQPTRRRREDTCSYVYVQDIIGREDDVEKIVHRLLNPDVEQHVSCLAIVGMGGLGKTALAQLVYNDSRIEKEFPLRLWTCVSDQDQNTLDVKAVFRKILDLFKKENREHLAMEPLQNELRDQLARNKYLIVLDDIWSENRRQLLELVNFLLIGLRGSWIVFTTRSQKTATIVGDNHVHKLNGLSEKDSWQLFEKTSFGQRRELENAHDLVEIGQEIVKKCAGVPLAIRVVGSLLYGHPKEKWLLFQKKGLGKLKDGVNEGIGPILKLSYHHLESPLKTCFSYCALFPKDHEIEKEMLINLWMAQGYVVPLEEGQSLQDASNEYFSILVKRCFFQDVKKYEYSETISCKIHDLMHDIAEEVAGKENYATNLFKTNLDSKIRHMSYSCTSEGTQCSFTRSKLRTCLRSSYKTQHIPVGDLLKNWLCLRTLDLSDSRIKSLPNVLGELLHLRYLDLSRNSELEKLPSSITKLHNLQTLKLEQCEGLKELPEDLPKLVKLRVLDINYVYKLKCMPRHMGRLSCLQKLPLFIVGDNNSTSKESIVDQMEQLKALENLKGSLRIRILKTTDEYMVDNVGERGYIKNKELLNDVEIEFAQGLEYRLLLEDLKAHRLLLEDLKPHPKLRMLTLQNYGCKRMPNWAIEDNLTMFLPNLVELQLYMCIRLQQLPLLRKLCNLKCLGLVGLYELECIENTRSSDDISDGEGTWESQIFFPSLEILVLFQMPQLKGWWSNSEHWCRIFPSFPRLSQLYIEECPNLTCIPPCPTLVELMLEGDFNEHLGITITDESGNSKLRRVKTSNVGRLTSILPMEAFQCLKAMNIFKDNEVESLAEVEDVFGSCLSSLLDLRICSCHKLMSVSGELKHLTALESLELIDLSNLSLSKGAGEEEDWMPWRCLRHSLRSLKLGYLPKMVKLPDGMRNLTALQSLIIQGCEKLKSVPEWMPELTSLKILGIKFCSDSLRERCRKPTGKDWPNIQHIQHIQTCHVSITISVSSHNSPMLIPLQEKLRVGFRELGYVPTLQFH